MIFSQGQNLSPGLTGCTYSVVSPTKSANLESTSLCNRDSVEKGTQNIVRKNYDEKPKHANYVDACIAKILIYALQNSQAFYLKTLPALQPILSIGFVSSKILPLWLIDK